MRSVSYRAAAAARLRPRSRIETSRKLTADAVLPPPGRRTALQTTDRLVAIGASTGGTEALRLLLEALPADAPGLAIVQHMPAGFTAAFARRLHDLCRIEVREAETGDRLIPGLALIAPGDHQRVFDLFRRAGPQNQPGEGIGLAHVRALAYRLGGTIDVVSTLGEGATFRLNLPFDLRLQDPVA